MKFDENVIDICLYLHEKRLSEQEASVFAGLAEQIRESSIVSDVIIGETDEGDTWLAVLNYYDEMMAHIEKVGTEEWLVVYYPEHIMGFTDPDDFDPICLSGPVEVLREALPSTWTAGGLSYA
uniref:Uncharacterized protein n=1 Tax=uncultured Alphaproteobacteria bacterium TaxID=91750 RepID=A0A1B0Z264_9PROT|nr:hypothetical protein [uncultured Alphaproteobacteria bacterium]